MVYIYILVMALVTYLIRCLPLTMIKGKIKSKFIRAFLYYVPYACLTAMTIPAVFSATQSIISGIAGLAVALTVSWFCSNLTVVAGSACAAVFVTELILKISGML